MKSLVFCFISIIHMSSFANQDQELLIKKEAQGKKTEVEILIEKPLIESINKNAKKIQKLLKIDALEEFDDLANFLENDVFIIFNVLKWHKSVLLEKAKVNKRKQISQLFWRGAKNSFCLGIFAGLGSTIIVLSIVDPLCNNDDDTWKKSCTTNLIVSQLVPPLVCWSASIVMYLGSCKFASCARDQKTNVDALKASYANSGNLPLIRDEEAELEIVDIHQLKDLLARLKEGSIKAAFFDALRCLENQIEKENNYYPKQDGAIGKVWNYFCDVLGQG